MNDHQAHQHDANGQNGTEAHGFRKTLTLPGTKVVGDDGYHAVIQAKYWHEYKALEFKVHVEYSHGGGSGDGAQDQVHTEGHHRADGVEYDGGDTNAINASNDMSAGAEPLQFGLDLMVVGNIEDQSQNGGNNLAQHGGGSSAGHAHLREGANAKDEDGVHNDVDDCAHALGDHGIEGASSGLEQPLKHDLHKETNGEPGADSQISHALVDDIRVVVLCQEEGLGEHNTCNGKDQHTEEGQENAVLCGAVGRIKVLGAQAAGEQGVDAHAGTYADGDHQVLIGEGHSHGSQCVFADFGHEVAVHHIVQSLHQHGDHHGQGHGEDQALDGHDAHFVFLQFRHKNLPTEKRAAANRCGKKESISLLF